MILERKYRLYAIGQPDEMGKSREYWKIYKYYQQCRRSKLYFLVHLMRYRVLPTEFVWSSETMSFSRLAATYNTYPDHWRKTCQLRLKVLLKLKCICCDLFQGLLAAVYWFSVWSLLPKIPLSTDPFSALHSVFSVQQRPAAPCSCALY